VTNGGNAGTIELSVDGPDNLETDWYRENCGAGVMVVDATVFGRVYINAPHNEQDAIVSTIASQEVRFLMLRLRAA
jgi:hypothetical protein